MKLRPYQRDSIDGLTQWFSDNHYGHPLIVMPTGSGKSVIIATMIKEILEKWPGQRILMLTHVKELIKQNAEKLHAVWPQAPLGIYSAGLKRRDSFQPIIFAGIQSVANKAAQLGIFDLIIIDECHLISNSGQTRYRKFLDDAKEINPHVRFIGLTATPFRTGSGSIIHGDNALFDDTAYEIKLLDLVDAGHLAPLVSKPIETRLDVEEVRTKQGEYIMSDLQRAVDHDDITSAALDEVMDLASDRKHWLVFCTGISHAEHVADAIRHRGITAECITGKTKSGQRKEWITRYHSGAIQALVSANVLTTGFDAPHTDLLVMLRPTQSPGLYVQIAGRGMRTAPGKEDCMVLDFAGNAERHGPVDKVEAWIPRPKEDGADAPQKTCPICGAKVPASALTCGICGYEFEIDQNPAHDTTASTAALLSNGQNDLRISVSKCTYHHHQKPGKRPTLRVDYFSTDHMAGLIKFASEWVCLEHEGFPRAKAAGWWTTRAGNTPAPESVTEALKLRLYETLRIPSEITYRKNGKYIEVIDYVWH